MSAAAVRALWRFFSSLLLENGFISMDVLAEPRPAAPCGAPPRAHERDGHRRVALRLKFSNGMVRECHLQAAEGACSPAGCLLPSASEPSEKAAALVGDLDGQRQKIWQSQ